LFFMQYNNMKTLLKICILEKVLWQKIKEQEF